MIQSQSDPQKTVTPRNHFNNVSILYHLKYMH